MVLNTAADVRNLAQHVHRPVDGPVASMLLDEGVHLLVQTAGALWHTHPCGVQPAHNAKKTSRVVCGLCCSR